MKIYIPLLSVVFVTGCATQPMYQWGGYDAMLYQSYKSPDKTLEFRQGLEAHLVKLEGSKQKAAPGLYAELGTLYLQSGDSTKAIAMYAKEKEAWPESKTLMESLITNVGKRTGPKVEVKS